MKAGGIANLLAPKIISNSQPYALDGYPARSIIIILTDKMITTNKKHVEDSINDDFEIFTSKLKLGKTEFLCEWLPKRWQRGNMTIKVGNDPLESFGDSLAKKLEDITNTNSDKKTNARTKKLGNLLVKKTKILNSFREDEFTWYNKRISIRTDHDRKKPKATLKQSQKIINTLNGLLFLWSIIEPARRLSRQEPSASQQSSGKYIKAINIDHIPVATMQIRALKLLENGSISIQDIFGQSQEYDSCYYEHQNQHHNAKYGVSTGKDVVSYFSVAKEKAEKLSNIDLPIHHLATKPSFFSRNYTKQVLKDGYGSGNESDNDDYSVEGLPSTSFSF